MEISSYQTKLEKFNGTKEQEKQLVKELNSKYGEHMGYYKTLAEWKSVLKQKGQKYCEMLLLEAQAQAVLNKYTESYINLLEVQDKAKKGDFDKWYRGKRGDARARQKAIKEAQDETDKWEAQYKDLQNRVQQIKDDNDLNFHIDPSAKGKTFDPKKAAIDQKKAVEEWKNAVKKYLKDAQNEIADYTLDAMAEGQAKELNQIDSTPCASVMRGGISFASLPRFARKPKRSITSPTRAQRR